MVNKVRVWCRYPKPEYMKELATRTEASLYMLGYESRSDGHKSLRAMGVLAEVVVDGENSDELEFALFAPINSGSCALL